MAVPMFSLMDPAPKDNKQKKRRRRGELALLRRALTNPPRAWKESFCERRGVGSLDTWEEKPGRK